MRVFDKHTHLSMLTLLPTLMSILSCSFHLYFHQLMLVNVKLENMGLWGLYFNVVCFIGRADFYWQN